MAGSKTISFREQMNEPYQTLVDARIHVLLTVDAREIEATRSGKKTRDDRFSAFELKGNKIFNLKQHRAERRVL